MFFTREEGSMKTVKCPHCGEIIQIDAELEEAVPIEIYKIVGRELVEYNGNDVSITIPEGVVSIADRAFIGCSSLLSVTFPSTLREIGAMAFCRCTNLQLVTCHPKSKVWKVRDWAFFGCRNLTFFDFEQVSYIGKCAFSQTAITMADLGAEKFDRVGDNAFSETPLHEINFRDEAAFYSFLENSGREPFSNSRLEYLYFNAMMVTADDVLIRVCDICDRDKTEALFAGTEFGKKISRRRRKKEKMGVCPYCNRKMVGWPGRQCPRCGYMPAMRRTR